MMTGTKRYTLPKNKRLKSNKAIGELFSRGKSLSGYPLRLVYLEKEFNNDEAFLVAFSVSKRKFKKAVDRNRIKRLMRECFRLQQYDLQLPKKTQMMWIYTGKELPEYHFLYQKMAEIIAQLNKNA